MKILVVDDIEDTRLILASALEAEGYTVEAVGNGVQALAAARRSPPDLIISDILMPKMDGFALCHAVKSDEQLRTIPFVFYTSTYVEPKDERLATALGASRFLIKPMEVEAFLKVIEEVLAEYRENRLAVPTQPIEGEAELERMYEQSLTRKLDQKVRELQAEREVLRDSEERFRSLVETTSDWIWEVNEHAVYTYVSPKIRDILGYTPDEVVGKTPFDLMPPHEAQRVGTLLERLARDRKPYDRLENANLHKDGRTVVLETSGVPVFEADGSFGGYRGIDRDITERKRGESELNRLLEENRRLHKQCITVQEEERRNLARELHDELGQALTGIRMNADYIRDFAPDLEPEVVDAADDILILVDDSVERLRYITNRLRPMTLDYVGLEEALRETTDGWAARNRSTECSFSASGQLAGLSEELNIALYRALQESLTNVARHGQAAHVEVQIDRRGEQVELRVRDDGRGMDIQAERSGMGLVGIRERVESLGGTFELRSALGDGLTLSVSLPVSASGEPPS